MSVLPSSDLPASSIEDIPDCAADVRAQSRLQIRLNICGPVIADIAAEVIRLAERFMPGVPHFLTIDGSVMIFRVRHGALRVCQTDLLVCRLARIHGVSHINAELRATPDGLVYGADLRGRSRTVRVHV